MSYDFIKFYYVFAKSKIILQFSPNFLIYLTIMCKFGKIRMEMNTYQFRDHKYFQPVRDSSLILEFWADSSLN